MNGQTWESLVAQTIEDCGPVRSAFELDLTAQTAEVGRARAFVDATLTDLDELQVDAVRLLVSELVTNAVLHGRSNVKLRLSIHDYSAGAAVEAPSVLVGVADESAAFPRQRQERDERATGRGLQIVGELADGWGWLPVGDETGRVQPRGKIVWFRVTSRVTVDTGPHLGGLNPGART